MWMKNMQFPLDMIWIDKDKRIVDIHKDVLPCVSSCDIVKASTEIVSAELKTDTKDLITAFGQACSYKLFSHKSYIVIPKNSPQDDISKLDALCLIFGIGLVLFDNSNVNEPQFEIRVRPLKHDPDMFYVNKNMRLVEKELFG